MTIKILEEITEFTPRYGTLKFVRSNKGWFWQYDRVLSDNACRGTQQPPKFIDKEETGEFLPYLDEVAEFKSTLGEAKESCLSELSNLFHMGCIAGYI